MQIIFEYMQKFNAYYMQIYLSFWGDKQKIEGLEQMVGKHDPLVWTNFIVRDQSLLAFCINWVCTVGNAYIILITHQWRS